MAGLIKKMLREESRMKQIHDFLKRWLAYIGVGARTVLPGYYGMWQNQNININIPNIFYHINST